MNCPSFFVAIFHSGGFAVMNGLKEIQSQILMVYFGGLQITPKRRYRRNKETV